MTEMYPWLYQGRWGRSYDTTEAQWTCLTPPTQEPITLLEAKQHARITQDQDDVTIWRYIATAREEAEAYLSRGLLTQTWQLSLRQFRDVLYLPMAAPLQNDPLANPSTAPVIQYYDSTGALQTLATTVYTVDANSRPARIFRASGQTWPTVQSDRREGAVVITYVVGWTDPQFVPERIKQGIRMYVAYLDCDREGLEQYGDRARSAAEACWSDRVQWIEPTGSVSPWRG